MNLTVRPATASDTAIIHQFIEELEETAFDFSLFQSIFHHNLQNPDCHYFLAYDNATCVGYASVHAQWLLHHCGRVGEIQEMFVIAPYRNKGVGTLLMQTLIEVATRENFQLLEVTANKKRHATHQFYEQQGFIRTHFKFVRN
ncbi:MAG: GNAT family N-acetyltransferase [Spirosomataceae bacterium]